MSVSVSTIVLKLYKPSLRKRIIIDEAMLNYSRAFQHLLDKAQMEIKDISETYVDIQGKYRANYITKWIDKNLDKELNKFNIEPFKDSIKIDFASTLAGYLNLKAKGNFVNYPTAYMSNEMLEKEYDEIMAEHIEYANSSTALEDKIKKLTYKSEKFRALFFCRYDINRNYSLLYNHENNRYYAKIYLMNVKNEKRKRLSPCSNKVLVYISKNMELFKEGLNKKCFILFPLSFGKWQEKFLKETINNPEMIKTARLVKRKSDYFLSINIVKDRPEGLETVNYMGISRGIDNAINYSIVDRESNLLSEGFEKVDNNNVAINKIHEIANHLVKVAIQNKCQVIMEKLADRSDRLNWRDKDGKSYIPSLKSYEYNQLFDILNYKIPNSGLPPIIRVSSISIFYTCPFCGINSKSNRFSSKIMICTSCGMTMDIEKAGSMNLARRLIKHSKDTIKIKVENTEAGIKFINKDLEFEYYPSDPYNCIDEFKENIDKIIKDFYINIDMESRNKGFKKKFSLIKKIEAHRDIFELITID